MPSSLPWPATHGASPVCGITLGLAPDLLELDDFELLRSARPKERRQQETHFAILPTLPTPADLWPRAITLGQACRPIGRSVLSLDLLVAAVALHHNAALVSFDADFEAIASVSALRLQRLNRHA